MDNIQTIKDADNENRIAKQLVESINSMHNSIMEHACDFIPPCDDKQLKHSDLII